MQQLSGGIKYINNNDVENAWSGVSVLGQLGRTRERSEMKREGSTAVPLRISYSGSSPGSSGMTPWLDRRLERIVATGDVLFGWLGDRPRRTCSCLT